MHEHTLAARTPIMQSLGVSALQFRMPRTQECDKPSTYGGQQATRLKVSNESNPTLAALRNRIRGQKTISLIELYVQNEEVDQVSDFELIPYGPINLDESIKEVWVEAIHEKINAIEINNNWELLDFLDNKNNIGVRCIYKTNLNVEGKVGKNKEIILAQGFSQQPRIDHNETFTPIARHDIARMVLTIAP